VLDPLRVGAAQRGVQTEERARRDDGERGRTGRSARVRGLLEDVEVRNQCGNLSWDSKLTAKKSLRRLGFICASSGISPGGTAELAREGDREPHGTSLPSRDTDAHPPVLIP